MYISTGRIVMMLPRRLRSPNQRANWRTDHGERQAWAKLIAKAECPIDFAEAKAAYGASIKPVNTRMKLEILRLAPNQRYMMDEDNLSASTKRLQDSLKEAGYIVDDNRRWLEGPTVTQGVSDDKCYWVIITLSEAAELAVYDFPIISARDEAKRRLKAATKRWTKTPSKSCGQPETMSRKLRLISSKASNDASVSQSTSPQPKRTRKPTSTSGRTTKTKLAETA
jgi:hypothetical protein